MFYILDKFLHFSYSNCYCFVRDVYRTQKIRRVAAGRGPKKALFSVEDAWLLKINCLGLFYEYFPRISYIVS